MLVRIESFLSEIFLLVFCSFFSAKAKSKRHCSIGVLRISSSWIFLILWFRIIYLYIQIMNSIFSCNVFVGGINSLLPDSICSLFHNFVDTFIEILMFFVYRLIFSMEDSIWGIIIIKICTSLKCRQIRLWGLIKVQYDLFMFTKVDRFSACYHILLPKLIWLQRSFVLSLLLRHRLFCGIIVLRFH